MHAIIDKTPSVVDDLIEHAYNEIISVGTCGEGEFKLKRRKEIPSVSSAKPEVKHNHFPRVVSIVSQPSSNIKGKTMDDFDSEPPVKEYTEASYGIHVE